MRPTFLSCGLFVTAVVSQQFSEDTIAKVKARLAMAANQSWELGTRAQALLELDAPAFSVFSKRSIPPPSEASVELSGVLDIAFNAAVVLPHDNSPRPLAKGAGGDPPSLGVAVLLANATGAPNSTHYTQAAQNQLDYLLNRLPQSPDGAISHRFEQLQLWSDFVYMVPPFLAYYGVIKNDEKLVLLAYKQCELYRQYLVDENTGLWTYMAFGKNPDPGNWSTGNGWVAAGMLRVLATMAHSNMAVVFEDEMTNLEHWVSEILDGMYRTLDKDESLFHNYADNSTTFYDAASSALIAASTYRLSSLRSVHDHIPDAERLRKELVSRIDADGWVAPVVNPESFRKEGAYSPEAQAFVLLLHAAHRDWSESGDGGLSGNSRASQLIPPSLAIILFAVTTIGTWMSRL